MSKIQVYIGGMSTPKNNLAEQMATLTKRNESLKNLLKRKRKSEPVASQSKRPTSSFSDDKSTSLPNTPLVKSSTASSSIMSPVASNLSTNLTPISSPHKTMPIDVDKITPVRISTDSMKTISHRVQTKLSPFLNKNSNRKPPDSKIINLDSDPEDFQTFGNNDDHDFEMPSLQAKTPSKKLERNKSISASPKDMFSNDNENGSEKNSSNSDNLPWNSAATTKPNKQNSPYITDEELSFIALASEKPMFDANNHANKPSKSDVIIPKGELLPPSSSEDVKFDTTSDYDLTTKSDKSFTQTVVEFNLLGSHLTSTQAPPQTTTISRTPVVTVKREPNTKPRSLNSKINSPDKGSGVLVKVQPSKSVKHNAEANAAVDNYKGLYVIISCFLSISSLRNYMVCIGIQKSRSMKLFKGKSSYYHKIDVSR